MGVEFNASTSALNVNEGERVKYRRRRGKCLAFTIFALTITTIVFVALYFTKAKAFSNLEAKTGANTGDKVKTTAEPQPTKPTEPTAAPTKPTEPTVPTKPTKPTVPTKPTKPTAAPTEAPTTISPKPTCTGGEPYCNIRLPNSTIPKDYDVYLNTDMDTFKVTGNTTITLEVKTATKYLITHARDYTKLTSVVKDSTGKTLPPTKTFLYNEKKEEYYVVEFDSDLAVGTYTWEFTFEYMLKDNLKGYYKASYKDTNGTIRNVAATQFQPVDARAAFPCLDEPALKAKFTITLAHDKKYFSLSNMPLKEDCTTAGDLMTCKFDTTPIMPTYLIAFVICDFANETTKANGTANNVDMAYYAPEDQIDQIKWAVKEGAAIIAHFEKYFNVTYPLPKADMIAIPDFAAGAMENWGLITYRTSALLWSPKHSAESNKQRVSAVVSHELAHQWFGNIVTMEWWSDLWLNEGFASYVEYLGIDNTNPKWNAVDDMVTGDMATAFRLDALVTSHPIYIPVATPSEIGEIFDSISYNKGASILRMLDRRLGTETFKKGLNQYLNKFSYSNAKTQDLWASLTKASKEAGENLDVKKFMDTWTLQMGYPVVNVKKNVDGSFTLSQERFYQDPNPDLTKIDDKFKNNSRFNYKWEVPFEYTSVDASGKLAAAKIVVMEMGDATIPASDVPAGSFVKGNLNMYGFYRVNYDEQGWKAITAQLKNDHKVFDVKDRAGMINDAFALAQAGRITYATAMDLLLYIENEEDYLPWRAASDAVSYIPDILTSTRPAMGYYKSFMKRMVEKIYNKVGFVMSDGDHLKTYLRGVVLGLACSSSGTVSEACQKEAVKMFKNYMANPKDPANLVPPNLRSLVYYYGILRGGKEEWDFLFGIYTKNQIASEKTKLLYGLSAIQEAWMIDRYLSYGLNETIVKSQDASYVFSYVANYNPIGRYHAFNFIEKNWNIISERFKNSFFTMRRIVDGVVSGFTTKYELEKMEAFVNSIDEPGTAKRIIDQSKEKINARIAWLERNEDAVTKWLNANK